jgi:hypothetical protein
MRQLIGKASAATNVEKEMHLDLTVEVFEKKLPWLELICGLKIIIKMCHSRLPHHCTSDLLPQSLERTRDTPDDPFTHMLSKRLKIDTEPLIQESKLIAEVEEEERNDLVELLKQTLTLSSFY